MQTAYDVLFDLRSPIAPGAVTDARRRLRLAETAVRLKKLQAVRRLVENATSADYWVSIVNDRLDRFRTDPSVYATTNYSDRRAGRNVPLFQSERELGLLRMQGRILCATNSYAIGLIEGLTSYVIGTGYTYRAVSRHKERPAPPELLDAVQDVIDAFQDRNEWYGGEQPGFEEELFWRSVEDGEFIVCATRTLEGDTDVRTVEPDQLTQRPGSNFEEYSFGIRTDPDDVQKPLAYWIFWGQNPADGDEYDPDQITHFRRNAKRSIKRGLTDFSFDTLDSLSLASKLRRNMSLGAAIQACFAGVRQHETATQGEVEGMQELLSDFTQTNPLSGRTEHYQKHEPGMVDIPKGMQFVQPPSATNAAAHVEILGACLRGAGVRWNAPEWIASADASNNNFASSLTAESPFVKTVTRRQHGYQETFKRLHWTAVENKVRARGELRVRKPVLDAAGEPTGSYAEQSYSWDQVCRLVDIQVEAPSPETRNKMEEAQTNQIYQTIGVKSPQTIQQELGLDPEEEAVNQEEWRERTGGQGRALGLPGDAGQLPPLPGGLPDGLRESLAGEDLTECGGEGGTPGPCPDKKPKAKKDAPAKKEKTFATLSQGPDERAGRIGMAHERSLRGALAGLKSGRLTPDQAHAQINSAAQAADQASYKNMVGRYNVLKQDAVKAFGPDVLQSPEWAEVQAAFKDGAKDTRAAGERMADWARDNVGFYQQDKKFDADVVHHLSQAQGEMHRAGSKVMDRTFKAFQAIKARFGRKEGVEALGESSWVLRESGTRSVRECEETPQLEAAALAVPDVRQNTDFSCGCAALKAVLNFFGIDRPEEEIRRGTGTESFTGTHQAELAEYARSCGLKAEVREGMTADDLANQLSAGRPVIALVYAHGTGHYVVVCGLSDGNVNLQDPATGPALMPLQEFVDRWVWVGSDNTAARRVGVVVGKACGGQTTEGERSSRQDPSDLASAALVVAREAIETVRSERGLLSRIFQESIGRDRQPSQITVNPPPQTINVNVPERQVVVSPPPPATVIVEAQATPPAPVINVNVPQQPPPTVNVTVPPPRPVEFRVNRDAGGKMTGGTIEPQEST